ncbi:MAG: sigma-70 family RNA polymerase sigma factor [Blastocatellia bacterium]|jgi:RNA polymerase sigma-70 factor, ECF subfamily|nr:sigma-70 family RNA polymerase sigma factor [Blastocatellia bacterium]MBN8721439.1 sigma-70 family RNA polymerase sigma factor [Acidobacteriota bacterium]
MSALSYSAELDLTHTVSSATDHELVLAVGQGDEAAFQEIVQRYRSQIINFIYRMINDYDRAIDLSQETFLRIYTSANRYQATYSFSTYIYRIASNLAISELRQRKRRRWISFFSPFRGKDDEQEQEMDFPAQAPLQDEVMIDTERRKAVTTAIQSLPEKYRLTLVMRDVEGLSYEQIVDITGLSEGTVKSRINRARNLLKDKLQKYV